MKTSSSSTLKRRLSILRLLVIASVLVFLLGCETPTGDGTSGSRYLSSVGLESGSWNRQTNQIEGKVGYFLSAQITYSIGTYNSNVPSGTTVRILESYVTDPEYQLFGVGIPPGLAFDQASGTLKGVPSAPGKWQLYPAVRCKVRGDNVYNGPGAWFTVDKTYNGHTWTQAKDPITISITE